MSFMERLSGRWERRREENGFVLVPRDILVQGSIDIAAHRDDVWQFLLAPEADFITSDDVVNVFRVPGTPLGAAGEQWVRVYERDGLLDPQISEIAVFEPSSRLVEVSRTAPWGLWSEVILSDILGGTSLTLRQGLKTVNTVLEVGLEDPDASEAAMRTSQRDWRIRVKRAIESGVRFPSQTRSDDSV